MTGRGSGDVREWRVGGGSDGGALGAPFCFLAIGIAPLAALRAREQLPHTKYGERAVAEALDLLQGTLDVLVLRTLAWGAMHGYAVSRWIRQRTDGVIEIEDAPLYKALHRLERAGFVEAEWGLSENNRRARFYALTPAGRRQLKAQESAWRRYAEAVAKVLAPA